MRISLKNTCVYVHVKIAYFLISQHVGSLAQIVILVLEFQSSHDVRVIKDPTHTSKHPHMIDALGILVE